ncbi:uncharacterized protein LOC128240804 isoform X2 [Mya arenaria]|uniref:uncharacterized protein LOC128240804 isoform X2 n=1 Tax=Mya arenaria TaxID=6604 RepID=UPI0022DFD656|nr:uncharacterized protein LOC128240804 isoform X2 [Mya arenaria]
MTKKKISQILVRIFGEELGKKCSTLPDDTCEALKDVVGKLVKRLQEQAELIDAEYGCVCIFTRFYDFLSYMDFLDDLVNGKLTKIALPLQNALRCCFGIEDLQVELVMEDEQFLQCFKNTLECVKNVYPLLKKTTRESDQGDKTLPNSATQSSVHSDAPVADVPDIIMSTFYTELDNNIDLTLSKNDANKYGMVLKDAIELFIAGQSQRQAPAVRAEREVKRLTKESIKTEEESISPTGKDQVQSYPGEARAVRLTKQDAESVDELMLQKGTDHVLSPALEKGEAAEGHFKQESTQSFDKDLLPKDSKILPRIDLKLLSLRKADVFRSTKQNEESETLLQKSNDPPSDQDQLLPVEAEEGLCLDEVSKGSVIFKCKPTRPNALETLTSFCNSGRIKAVISAFFSVPSALENLPQAGFVQRLTIDAAFVDYENERNLQDVTLKFQRYSENDTEKEQKDPKIKSRMSDKTLRSTELIYQGIVRFTIEDKELKVQTVMPLVRSGQDQIWSSGMNEIRRPVGARIEREKSFTEISSCVQPDVVNKDISKRQDFRKLQLLHIFSQDFEMQELFHRKRPDLLIEELHRMRQDLLKEELFHRMRQELKVQTVMPLVRSGQDQIWSSGMNEIRRPVGARIEREKSFTEISSCVQPDVVNKDISKRQDFQKLQLLHTFSPDFEMQDLFHRKRSVLDLLKEELLHRKRQDLLKKELFHRISQVLDLLKEELLHRKRQGLLKKELFHRISQDLLNEELHTIRQDLLNEELHTIRQGYLEELLHRIRQEAEEKRSRYMLRQERLLVKEPWRQSVAIFKCGSEIITLQNTTIEPLGFASLDSSTCVRTSVQPVVAPSEVPLATRSRNKVVLLESDAIPGVYRDKTLLGTYVQRIPRVVSNADLSLVTEQFLSKYSMRNGVHKNSVSKRFDLRVNAPVCEKKFLTHTIENCVLHLRGKHDMCIIQ